MAAPPFTRDDGTLCAQCFCLLRAICALSRSASRSSCIASWYVAACPRWPCAVAACAASLRLRRGIQVPGPALALLRLSLRPSLSALPGVRLCAQPGRITARAGARSATLLALVVPDLTGSARLTRDRAYCPILGAAYQASQLGSMSYNFMVSVNVLLVLMCVLRRSSRAPSTPAD